MATTIWRKQERHNAHTGNKWKANNEAIYIEIFGQRSVIDNLLLSFISGHSYWFFFNVIIASFIDNFFSLLHHLLRLHFDIKWNTLIFICCCYLLQKMAYFFYSCLFSSGKIRFNCNRIGSWNLNFFLHSLKFALQENPFFVHSQKYAPFCLFDSTFS